MGELYRFRGLFIILDGIIFCSRIRCFRAVWGEGGGRCSVLTFAVFYIDYDIAVGLFLIVEIWSLEIGGVQTIDGAVVKKLHKLLMLGHHLMEIVFKV